MLASHSRRALAAATFIAIVTSGLNIARAHGPDATEIALGSLIDAELAFARMSSRWPLWTAAAAYIELVRDTPVLVQMYFIYFGFSMAGFGLTGFVSGLLALSLQNGGYIAEIHDTQK